jgi:hypothetical protein
VSGRSERREGREEGDRVRRERRRGEGERTD